MATDVEFIAKLRSLAEHLRTEVVRVVETMALTGFSLVKDRLQSEGVAGAAYSTNPIPEWWLKDKQLNNKGAIWLDELSSTDVVTWGNFRKAQGLQSEFVDLTYTGRMLGGVVLQQVGASGYRFYARLGGSDEEVDKKLDWNTKRYGDFMQPNEEEQKEIDAIAEDFITDLIKRFLP